MGNSAYSTIIKIKEELREGFYWVVTSENMPGLLLGGKDLAKIRHNIPSAIKKLYKLNYEMDVEVRPACDVMPNEIASCRHPVNWAANPINAQA